MLQTQTVEPGTLALLKQLMKLEELKDYYLVGGTSLSLQYGHRISVDLDFFGKPEINFTNLLARFENSFNKVEPKRKDKPIYQLFINNVKIDIVAYPYDLIEPLIIIDGIRLASPKDIAAMKMTAIGTRAAKKDFYDLYFLLEHYSLFEMTIFFENKFPGKDIFHYIRSLTYFDDVEQDSELVELLKPVTWSQVKDRILLESRKLTKQLNI